MSDKFVSLEEIKAELKDVENLTINLSRSLRQLNQQIKYIISQIKDCETLNAANYYFHLLENIQSTLAIIIFKEEIGIPDKLRKFVSNFDNLEQDKEYYYKQIRDDQYQF